MRFYQQPDEFRQLAALYWKLRMIRPWDQAGRRRWYRAIRVERDRLEASGIDAELIRLYCRHMAAPVADSPALRRLMAYQDMLVEWAKVKAKLCAWGESATRRSTDSRIISKLDSTRE